MAFKVFRDQTVVRVDDTTGLLTSHFFNPTQSRYFIFKDDFIIQDNVTGFRLNVGAFDNIRKSDDSTPTDLSDAITYLNSFINFKLGGGGEIRANHIFADDAARDTYFGTDPNYLELTPGVTIISGGEIQRWAAETPTSATNYSGTNFVDITGAALSAAQIKVLYESNAETNALVDSKLAILNLLSRNSEGHVVSSESWEFPPDTVYVSENLGIEAAGEAFGVLDRANNRRGFLVAYETGIDSKPFYRNLDSFDTNVVIQGIKDTVSPTDTYSEDITFTSNRLVTKVYLESDADATGANLILRRGGFIVAAMLNQSFTANTIKEIEIQQGVFFANGSTVTLDVEGVNLKGTGTGVDFKTAIAIDNYTYTTTTLASEEYVNEKRDVAIATGYFLSNQTLCPNKNQWYKVDADLTTVELINFIYDAINKKLIYNNGGEGLSVIMTFTSSHEDTRSLEWELRVNGLATNYPPKNVTIRKDTDMSVTMLIPYIEFETGDYIELYCRVLDIDDDTIDIENFTFLIR